MLFKHALRFFGKRACGEYAIRGGRRIGEVRAVKLAENGIDLAIGRLLFPLVGRERILAIRFNLFVVRVANAIGILDHPIGVGENDGLPKLSRILRGHFEHVLGDIALRRGMCGFQNLDIRKNTGNGDTFAGFRDALDIVNDKVLGTAKFSTEGIRAHCGMAISDLEPDVARCVSCSRNGLAKLAVEMDTVSLRFAFEGNLYAMQHLFLHVHGAETDSGFRAAESRTKAALERFELTDRHCRLLLLSVDSHPLPAQIP